MSQGLSSGYCIRSVKVKRFCSYGEFFGNSSQYTKLSKVCDGPRFNSNTVLLGFELIV